MPVLAALPESSAPSGGPGMRGGASRPRPPPPGMRQCDRHRRRGPRRRARRGKGCWQPLLVEKCLPATGEPSPGRSPGNIPRHTVGSVGAGSGKSICLSLAMGNMQPFVSLDEVRYSAACHENTGAKWLQRPPPPSGEREWGVGVGAPRGSAVPWGGLGPAGFGGRPGPCGSADGNAAPRKPAGGCRKATSRCPLPGADIPTYPGSLEHPKGRTGRVGGGGGRTTSGGAGRCRGCGCTATPRRRAASAGPCCLPAVPASPRPGGTGGAPHPASAARAGGG